MHVRNRLLSSTAVVSTTMLLLSGAPDAAEVKPGGALNLSIEGFARFEVGGGEQNDLNLDNSFARGLDFINDTEVHVLAHGRSEQTGLEYGATIEFLADTNQTDNTDETWVFLKGGWGEVRMGDQNGVVENSIVGGQTIAAGTGGIDGSDFVILPVVGEAVFPTRTEDATKIRYYTPSFGGFSLGVSYTPTQSNLDSGANNGQFIARKNGANAMQAENIVEGGLIYDGDVAGIKLETSLVGQYGKLKNSGEADFGGSDWYSGIYGAALDIQGFKLAGSIGTDKVGDQDHQFMTAGIAYGYGPANASITYAWIFDSNNDFSDAQGYDKPQNLVASADYALAPGLALAGDVSLFNNDTNSNYTGGTGDTGWAGVASVRLTF